MPKNNLPQNQLCPNNIRPVKNWTDFGVKLIFAVIVAFTVFFVNPRLFELSYGGIPTGGNNITAKQLVLAGKSQGTPNPSLLAIPTLGIIAPFEPLGLNANHTIEVPKNNMGVGWFIYRAKPGEIGASVVIGHLDSVWGRAVFADLDKIKGGDKIYIRRTDGSVVIYRVDSVQKFSRKNFPTEAVYGKLSYAGLRLITCGGAWDKKAGHYSDNLVIFASAI